VRAPSSVGALDKRSGDEHHVIGSFSTDPEEEEIILNEENLRPQYSETEDMATHDVFRLQGIMSNLREKRNNCKEKTQFLDGRPVHKCRDDCICESCARCVLKSAVQAG